MRAYLNDDRLGPTPERVKDNQASSTEQQRIPGREFALLGAMATVALALALRTSLCSAQTYQMLHAFTGADGRMPVSGLTFANGYLYGATELGGYYVDEFNSYGTVFRIRTDGTGFGVLKIFHGTDGQNPEGRPVIAGNTLYGTTRSGGAQGVGILYRLNTDGSGFAVLHTFSGADGTSPVEVMVAGDVIYGVTQEGGPLNRGEIYRVNTNGTGFSVLCAFPNSGYPRNPPMLHGNLLYGTTLDGSDNGSIYQMATDGSGFNCLHSFTAEGGAWPEGGVTASGAGLYGVTTYDARRNLDFFGYGKVFRVDTNGSNFRVLHQFDWQESYFPVGGVVVAGEMLYGVTGGLYGSVYRLMADGRNYTVLRGFTSADQGPTGRLLLLTNKLYGVTWQGGISNYGTVYSLSLPPPIILSTPQTQTAEVGAAVRFDAPGAGSSPVSYRWYFNRTNFVPQATNSPLRLTGVQPTQAGAYTAVLSDIGGSITSSPAFLSVIPAAPRRLVPAIQISGTPGRIITIETAGTLLQPSTWTTLDSVNLFASPQFYFDSTMSPSPQRYYRTSEATTAAPSVLALQMVPAIAMTGNVGSSVRVDYINQFGPTNAWTTLATVQLTNTTQAYFDVSSIGQLPRLYRVVAIP